MNEFSFNNSPLHAAAAGGHIRAATILLDAGADVNLTPKRPLLQTPLITAADNGRLDMVRFLLARGANALARADPYDPSTTARLYAQNKRNPELMAVLEEAERAQSVGRKPRALRGLAEAEANSLLLLLAAPLGAAGDAFLAAAGGGGRREAGVLGWTATLAGRTYFAARFHGAPWDGHRCPDGRHVRRPRGPMGRALLGGPEL